MALSDLLGPLSIADFFKLYEKNEPYLVHHGDSQLTELRELPLVQSLDSLLHSWPSNIQAHLPDIRDEMSSIDTTPLDAKKLYSNGMGLLFNDAHLYSKLLNQWVDELRKDLGLSQLTVARSLIYATPDGKGTAAHFDQNINFVLQIHGTKRWTMAPNDSVENPLTRHTMGQAADPELDSYLEQELPTSMPKNAKTYDLKPGSLLFVPRGYWHSTVAEGDALALNFTFSPPSWLDLFMAALRSRLIQSPEWRETANGVSGNTDREDAEDKLDALLGSLVQDLPEWRAEDILSATEADPLSE